MHNNIQQNLNSLRVLTIAFLSFLGSQMLNTAKAEQWTPGIKSTNEILIAQQKQVCKLQSSPEDNRQGVSFRNQPVGGQSIAFFNNGTSVTVINRSNDGQWTQVIAPNNIQGWVYSLYLQNCNTLSASQLPNTGNTTGGVPIGTMCQVTGWPDSPNIPVQDFPNARSKPMPYLFNKGTQLQVSQPPAGQQSQRKWVYVRSMANSQQVGWVWKNYIQCN
ncbi:MAG: SH3 domain-containing protein [Trichodesmium sp. MAG_R01]|nr:SH3 domain-containing protein [Trichodesmium sp. MAG_R01]